jgi:hypothetical protein
MSNEEQESNLGFFKKSKGTGVYFSIYDYSICQRSKTQIEGWEGPRETTNPKTNEKVFTWFMRYDSIATYIVDVNKFKVEFAADKGGGKASGIKLTLAAGTMRAELQLQWGDKGPEPVFKRFLKVAPNIDFNQPILISAFKTKDGKQAVSFKQGTDNDPQKWDKVEEYWKREIDPVTEKAVTDAPQMGADGTVLPPPIHDEFDDSWSYVAQNRFLMVYFMEKIEPKIKEIAKAKGIKQEEAGETPTHTGVPDEVIPVVTEKPANPVAQTLQEAATGAQRAEIKSLSVAANFDFEAQCQSVMGCSFSELNKLGASFAIYKLKEMVAKQGQTAPVQQAQAASTATAAPAAPATAPAPASDDWGTASAPATTHEVASEAAPWD